MGRALGPMRARERGRRREEKKVEMKREKRRRALGPMRARERGRRREEKEWR